jgi:hypothetical protein
MTASDGIGVAGAMLVFATFWTRDALWLRSIGLLSNVVFIAYAALAELVPILVLHGALMILNALRLHQLFAVRRAARPLRIGVVAALKAARSEFRRSRRLRGLQASHGRRPGAAPRIPRATRSRI